MLSWTRKIQPVETVVENSPPPEATAEDKVHAIAATLKKLYCERYVHGKRIFFGRTEALDGEFLENHVPYYSWPSWKVHSKSRDTYKDLNERFHVPDEKVRWNNDFQEYSPDFANEADQSDALTKLLEKRKPENPHGPDLHLRSFVVKHRKRQESNRFLECQDAAIELRHAPCGPDDKMRNPYGRTGLKGKGILQNWGANYACDPVITRVDPSPAGRTQVLVCLSAANPGVWCLPGGIIQDYESEARANREQVKLPTERKIPELLATILIHNAPKKDDRSPIIYSADQQPLDFLSTIARDGLSKYYDPNIFEQICCAFRDIFECSKLVYRGYCDDPRNTDDAWIETFVHHCHLPESLAKHLNISNEVSHWKPAGSLIEFEFQWLEVGLSAITNLFPSHFDFVELCVPFCKCGRRRFDQSDNSHQNTEFRLLSLSQSLSDCDAEWIAKEASGGSDAGDVQFIGKSTNSHYARARMETEEDIMHVRMLLDAWGMKQPKTLISLTGGAQTFSMDQGVIEDVFQGILKAATVTNACISDGGTDTGVMKLMGEAVARDGHRVDLIGVATWGIIISRECMLQELTNKNGLKPGEARKRKPSNQFPMRRRGSVALQLENLIEDFRMHTKSTYYLKTQPNSAMGAGLDPNHRYFILVDDGSVGRFGAEISARAQLEQVLRDPKKFAGFKKVWEMSQGILLHWDPKAGDLPDLETMPSNDIIALRNYLHAYYLNHLKAVQAVRILEKELQSRLGQPSTSRSEKAAIKQITKIWQHLRTILAGNQADDLLEELADEELWSNDDLDLLHKYLLKSHLLYESSDKFRVALDQFETKVGRRRSTIAPLGSPVVRSPIPKSPIPKKFSEIADSRRQSKATESGKDGSPDFLDFGSSWRSGTLKKQLSGIKSIQQNLKACHAVQEEEHTTGPEGKTVSSMQVPHCFRCEGNFRDRITLKRWKNSIPQEEYDEWIVVQRALKEKQEDSEILVRCGGCKSKLHYEDIEKETFHPCTACNHYFLGSRALYLRQKGRPHINCDQCGTRRPLDDLLGRIVPGVLIVVQGGPGTIETVASTNKAPSLEPAEGTQDFPTLEQSSKTCTPIVVVEGSGKAADLIAFTWRHQHQGRPQCYGCPRSNCVGAVRRYDSKTTLLLPATCPLVIQEYQKIFWTENECDCKEENGEHDKKELAEREARDKKKRDDMAKHVSWVIEVCRRKESVTIFNAEQSDTSLVYAIMRAICKGTLRDGQALSTVEQLQLAIDWDLAEDELTAVMLARREILNDDSWDVGESASDLRESLTTAMVYALKRNSWRFVELLDHAGAILPNRELLLKSLYPREIDQFSNETVIPNRLRLIMNLPEVKLATKRKLFEKYRNGVLSDEDADSGTVFQSMPIEETHSWQHVMDHVVGLKEPPGRSFLVEHCSRVDGVDVVHVARTERDLARIRHDEKGVFREKAKLVLGFEEFDRLVGRNFKDIFGTKAHVEAVMEHMGWTKPKVPGDRALAPSNEHAYSELFVWSMLMGRTQLAKLFWRRCPATSQAHCVSRALFASAVVRRMALIAGGQARKLLIGDKAEGGPQARSASDDKASLAAQFEGLAKRLMRKGFETDPPSAVNAMLLPWEAPDCWLDCEGRAPESLSPLMLAGYAKAESFVDDPAFQACVDMVWYGGLVLDDEQGQSKLADEDYILVPFVGSHMGELGLRQKWFLGLASGGAAIPASVVMALFDTWEASLLLLVASYALLPLCMLFLSRHYRCGRCHAAPPAPSSGPARASQVHGREAGRAGWVWRVWRTCVIFYTAPIVKFVGRWIHFVLFVLLYTYVGVTLAQDRYTLPEAVMHAWIFLLLIAEIRQLLESGIRRCVDV